MKTDQHIDGMVLKLASRCNINCTYCYMYNLEDKTYIHQPKFMSNENIDLLFFRLKEYLQSHSEINHFHIGLHGGEPLLAPREKFERIFRLRDETEDLTKVKISISIQTNGLLINDDWIDLFYKNDVGIGVSFDGLPEYHDKYRITFTNEGTHDEVLNKIKWLNQHSKGSKLFSSVLCVLQPNMDGGKLIDYYYENGIKGVDFILPDQNYSITSTEYPSPKQKNIDYGQVLVDAYYRWREIDDPAFRVRKFEIIMKSLFGLRSGLDSIGNNPLTLFTLETVGEYEPVDSMKCCGDSFTKTGNFLSNTTFDEFALTDIMQIGFLKGINLSKKCQNCSYKEICGGGYLPHRFYDGSFEHPSIYCDDLFKLIDTIYNDIAKELDKINKKMLPTLHSTHTTANA